MISILHNPRCRKSREGLELLKNSGRHFTVVPYMDESLSADRLREIINFLGIEPIQLVRTNEAIWKDKYKGKTLSNAAIIMALSDHPRLIERPIVIIGKKAVIGRPPEVIAEFLNSGGE
jgi:arsenate reductase